MLLGKLAKGGLWQQGSPGYLFKHFNGIAQGGSLCHAAWQAANPASLHTSLGSLFPGVEQGPGGGEESPRTGQEGGLNAEEDTHEAKQNAQGMAHRAAEHPGSFAKETAGKTVEELKQAGVFVGQFAKETGAAMEGYAKEALEKAREESERALGLAMRRTDKEIDDELEEKVRKGAAGFVPEETKSPEEQRTSVGTTAPSQKVSAADADEEAKLVRGDTVAGLAHGSTSKEARMGGQAAGSVGKPPADN